MLDPILFHCKCCLLCGLDSSLTKSLHEAWLFEHHIRHSSRIKPFMLRNLLYIRFHFIMCSTSYIYGYFVLQLRWFHHQVPQSLLIRNVTPMTRMPCSGPLHFIINQIFCHVHPVIPSFHHQSCYLI